MKLLSVSIARAIWLCNILDFNPKGKYLYPAITSLLVGSYKFKKFPAPNDVLDGQKGIIFENGEFQINKNESIAINLNIYNDGLVVDTRSSTKDSDAFLHEILSRFSEEFNLPHYKQVIKNKQYASRLYFTTTKSLTLINPKLKEVSDYLSDNVLGHGKVSYEAGGISFWTDQTRTINASPFSIERAINTPFSENRYLSTSALQTDKHLKLLDKLESIL